MSSYREQGLEAKQVRRGIEEPRPVGGKKRQGKKRLRIECFCFNRWGWSGNYATLEQANQAWEIKTRRCPDWGFRLKDGETVLRQHTPPPRT